MKKILLLTAFFALLLASTTWAASATVSRDLPSTAYGGTYFTVSLAMDVNESSAPNSVGITDYYPATWTVSNISTGGVDQGGRVEWLCTPFTTCRTVDQTLTYTIYVPESASGTYSFTGTWYITNEGETTILGDTSLVAMRRVVNVSRSLPDTQYAGSSITVNLAVAVDEAHKPSSFNLTESVPSGWTASDISGGGVFSSGTILWTCSDSSACPVADQNMNYTLTLSSTSNGTYSLSGAIVYIGGATDAFTGDSTVQALQKMAYVSRDLPSSVSAGSSYIVYLNMSVDESAAPVSAGVTEYYPNGWSVSNISAGGIDRGDRIEWTCSSITDCHVEDQTLTYVAAVPAAASSGTASFSGTVYNGAVTYSITGESSTEVSAEAGGGGSETCDLVGDYTPCGEISISEVIEFITLWSSGEAELSDVIALISAWSA